jgi:hypothetical protein
MKRFLSAQLDKNRSAGVVGDSMVRFPHCSDGSPRDYRSSPWAFRFAFSISSVIFPSAWLLC